jgi:hypothetical protein
MESYASSNSPKLTFPFRLYNDAVSTARLWQAEDDCHLGYCAVAMMMEAISTSQISVNFYTRRNIPEDSHHHTRRPETLKYHLWQADYGCLSGKDKTSSRVTKENHKNGVGTVSGRMDALPGLRANNDSIRFNWTGWLYSVVEVNRECDDRRARNNLEGGCGLFKGTFNTSTSETEMGHENRQSEQRTF